MPNLPLNVTHAQGVRIREAFKNPETGEPATPDDISQWIMRQIRDRVLRYELGKVSADAEAAKRAELIAEGW